MDIALRFEVQAGDGASSRSSPADCTRTAKKNWLATQDATLNSTSAKPSDVKLQTSLALFSSLLGNRQALTSGAHLRPGSGQITSQATRSRQARICVFQGNQSLYDLGLVFGGGLGTDSIPDAEQIP